jgi:CarD family transcriptional regulator
LKLAVGDIVAYGSHGAGPVVARETRTVGGEQQTVIVVALAAGLSVQLPLSLAEEQLRPIVDEADIANIREVLRAARTVNDDSWLKRRREAEAKLGDPVGLAEIVRDGDERVSAPVRGQTARLSPSERELVRRARELLTQEIALSRDVEPAEASGWIDEQLAITR